MFGCGVKLSIWPRSGHRARAVLISVAATVGATWLDAEAAPQGRAKQYRQTAPVQRMVRPALPASQLKRNWQPARPGVGSVPTGSPVAGSARPWTPPSSKFKREKAVGSGNYVLTGLLTLLAGTVAAVWRWRARRRAPEAGVDIEAKPKQVENLPSAVSLIRTIAPFSSAVRRLPEKAKISEAILKEAMVEPDHQAAASPQSLPVFKTPEVPRGSGPTKIRVSRDPCTLERFTQIECTINAAVETMLQREFHLRLPDWLMISNFWNSPARFSMPPLPLEDGASSIEPCSLDEFVELQVAVNRVTDETLKQEFSLLDRDWLKIKHYWYARYPRSESLMREYKQHKAKYQRSAGMTAA